MKHLSTKHFGVVTSLVLGGLIVGGLLITGGIKYYQHISSSITELYPEATYQYLSDQAIANLPSNAEPSDKVEALLSYVRHQVKPEMMPGYDLPAFSYLEIGYAFCDQMAAVLMHLLAHQGITSRVVPLYFEDGSSTHTAMEWFDGTKWQFIDPLYGYIFPLSGEELAVLDPTDSTTVPTNIDQAAITFYQEHRILDQIKATYAKPDYKTWGPIPLATLPNEKDFDRLTAALYRLQPKSTLSLLRQVYLAHRFPQVTPESKYLSARHKELLGQKKKAKKDYVKLLQGTELPDDWPDYGGYSINKKVIEQRLTILEESVI